MKTTNNYQTVKLTRLFAYQNMSALWETMYIGDDGNYYYQGIGIVGIQKTNKQDAEFTAWNTVNSRGGWISNFSEWESKKGTENAIPKVLFSEEIQNKRVALMVSKPKW